MYSTNMKKILLPILLFFAGTTLAQTSLRDKDSLANLTSFQVRIKIAGQIAAHANLNTIDSTYCRYIMREPEQSYWINQLAYGAALSGFSWADSDSTLQTTINTLFPTFGLIYRSK